MNKTEKKKYELMESKEKIDSHTVPVTYLKHFYNEKETLWEIKTILYKDGLGNPKPKKAEQICYIKNFYKLKTIDENRYNTQMIEYYFNDEFERIYDEFYNRIVDCVKSNKYLLNKDDETFWIKFIITQMLRTKQNINISNELIKRECERNEEKNEIVDIKKDALLCGTFYCGKDESIVEERTSHFMKTHKIKILCSNEVYFITSDNPVISPPYCNDFIQLYKKPLHILPISKNIAIALIPNSIDTSYKILNLTTEQTNKINNIIITYCFERIICTENPNTIKELTEKIIKNRISNPKFSGMYTESGFSPLNSIEQIEIIHHILNQLDANRDKKEENDE